MFVTNGSRSRLHQGWSTRRWRRQEQHLCSIAATARFRLVSRWRYRPLRIHLYSEPLYGQRRTASTVSPWFSTYAPWISSSTPHWCASVCCRCCPQGSVRSHSCWHVSGSTARCPTLWSDDPVKSAFEWRWALPHDRPAADFAAEPEHGHIGRHRRKRCCAVGVACALRVLVRTLPPRSLDAERRDPRSAAHRRRRRLSPGPPSGER